MVTEMDELDKGIIYILRHNPGLSDGELSTAIKGEGRISTSVNQNCRYMESKGMLLRHKREDGLIGNWLVETKSTHKVFQESELESNSGDISEKTIKKILFSYLTSHGWAPEISWGFSHGIDIEAKMGHDRWIIQVRGSGLFPPIIVNNFLSVLGAIIQRMDDPQSKYSIALPDKEQFHRLWERLPGLAKSRMGITALFVNPEGRVNEEF